MDPLPCNQPPRPVYRLGRRPEPWDWPDWDYQHDDGTFGNRWDDPDGLYRVLYAASQRIGTFLEVLACHRPDPDLIAELGEIEGETDAVVSGQVPMSRLEARVMGEAALEGRFADIDAVASLAYLRSALAARLGDHELEDLDASAIKSGKRKFTQEVSRHVYELSDEEGRRVYDGVAYASRLGDDQHNWAIFESPDPATNARVIQRGANSEISSSDPDLVEAVRILGLELIR